uniref:protein ASPARTIC PROTEASE IN GUARD CELL 1-like n=1 Tax=Erigeron canadensis TaxID=72917 RepID=UPI001CB92DEC|nr:protein ASPARTIC PROTEASE IN GUARD CELL 1-like [Erigeron canadensis]
MVKLKNKLLLLLLISILFTSTLTASAVASTTTTTVFHVTESIQKTLNAVSHTPKHPSQILTQSTSLVKSSSSFSSSTLSLQLHTRSSIHKPSSHKNYNSLVLSRLARDSSRVNSLQTRLHLAVNNISKPNLKPLFSEYKSTSDRDLQVPVVSGTSQGSGEYFSRVGIGHPPSQVYMVIDTGSDVSWLQCAPCADCYQQTDPIYEPQSSSTYSPITCEARDCKSLEVSECRNDTCLYQVSYGDGSYTVGDFATETVTLTDSVKVNDIAIGCGHNNEGLFVGAAGLIGLGGGKLSFPSQINATSYSYCLVDRDSDATSSLDFNSPIPKGAVTAPLLKSDKIDTFYYVNLTGISVGGDMVNIPEKTFLLSSDGDGGVIVDSGTAVTRFETTAYNALRDAFVSKTKKLKFVNSVALFDTCYDFSKMKSVQVPTVSFHFSNGQKLGLPAKNYLIPIDSNGTFCFAFAATTSSLSIIGNVQQQGIRVTYDFQRSIVGFTSNEC